MSATVTGRRVGLVLTRRVDQRIIIETADGPVVVTLVGTREGRAKIGIDAPGGVLVRREEMTEDDVERLRSA